MIKWQCFHLQERSMSDSNVLNCGASLPVFTSESRAKTLWIVGSSVGWWSHAVVMFFFLSANGECPRPQVHGTALGAGLLLIPSCRPVEQKHWYFYFCSPRISSRIDISVVHLFVVGTAQNQQDQSWLWVLQSSINNRNRTSNVEQFRLLTATGS